MICERLLEKSLAMTYTDSIMIHPHGAVLPIRMGIAEMLMELPKAVYLLKIDKLFLNG